MVNFTPFITALNKKTIQKNNTKKENKEGEFEVKEVTEIKISYEDGSSRTLKKGIALDFLSPTEALVDCKNLEDDDILTFIEILREVARQKRII